MLKTKCYNCSNFCNTICQMCTHAPVTTLVIQDFYSPIVDDYETAQKPAVSVEVTVDAETTPAQPIEAPIAKEEIPSSIYEMEKEMLIDVIHEYDSYIQEANEDNRYAEGWLPVCIDEFINNEFIEEL